MKNKLFIFFISFLFCTLKSFSSTLAVSQQTNTVPATPVLKPINSATTPIQAQNREVRQITNFESCVRAYQTSPDNLLLLVLAAINSSGYKIDEIQSRTGLASFVADNRSFLVSVTELDENSSLLKITPMNNSYNFSAAIVENIFLYLSNNMK